MSPWAGMENLRRAIGFAGPEYLPVHLEVYYPWLQERDEAKLQSIDELASAFPNDLCQADPVMSLVPPVVVNGTAYWTHEWGVS